MSDDEKQLQVEAEARCREELRTAWSTCRHLDRFEAWAALYYRRFGRLSPGKSDVYCDSNDPENRALCDAWHSTGLAAHDAIMEVVRLEDEVRELRDKEVDQ